MSLSVTFLAGRRRIAIGTLPVGGGTATRHAALSARPGRPEIARPGRVRSPNSKRRVPAGRAPNRARRRCLEDRAPRRSGGPCRRHVAGPAAPGSVIAVQACDAASRTARVSLGSRSRPGAAHGRSDLPSAGPDSATCGPQTCEACRRRVPACPGRRLHPLNRAVLGLDPVADAGIAWAGCPPRVSTPRARSTRFRARLAGQASGAGSPRTARQRPVVVARQEARHVAATR